MVKIKVKPRSLWNFGDGSPLETTLNANHIYANAGVYQVDLTATSVENCSSSDVKMVNIYDQPFADFLKGGMLVIP